MATTEAKTNHDAKSESGKERAAHSEANPPKRKSFLRKMLDKIPTPKSEDFKARPLLERAKWALAGGTAVAWLHSSILFPALALTTTSAFLINKFILKADHHGGSHGGGH